VVSVLVIVPKVRGFKPGRGRCIFKGIKIHNTPSFGGEIKPSVRSCSILRHVKDPYKYERNTFYAKFTADSSPCLSCFSTR
jgi:hypothetical protein